MRDMRKAERQATPGESDDLLPLVTVLMLRAGDLIDTDMNTAPVVTADGDMYTIDTTPLVSFTRSEAILAACSLIAAADPLDRTWPITLAAVRQT